MRRSVPYACLTFLMGSAAFAAEPGGCLIRKGIYDSWLALSKKPARPATRVGSLLGSVKPVVEPASAPEVHEAYEAYLQCLSDAPVPETESDVYLMCKDADADRLGSLVCQLALYLKTNRTRGSELLNALSPGKKGGELVWDLESIAGAAASENHFPSLFSPQGPAFKLIDELFVLALDDRETAISKYFHIASESPASVAPHVDAQIKILLRESPALVVTRWQIFRQYRPRVRRILDDLSKELTYGEMDKLRMGIAGFCSKEYLDCPEIERFFGLQH